MKQYFYYICNEVCNEKSSSYIVCGPIMDKDEADAIAKFCQDTGNGGRPFKYIVRRYNYRVKYLKA